MMRSLKTRLLIGTISGMILLLFVFSTIIYVVIRSALVNQFDASLISTTQMLSALTEQKKDEVDVESEIQLMAEFKRKQKPAYYQFWTADGTELQRSLSLDTNDLSPFGGTLDKPIYKVFKMSNGQPVRAISIEFKPRLDKPKRKEKLTESEVSQPFIQQQTITLVIARDTTDLQYHLWFLRCTLLIVSVSTIGLSFFIAAPIVRTGLKPLNSLATQIENVDEGDLTARIDTENMLTELTPIKERLNDLLSRLEKSFNRERRFTADVAHELRTPLAGIRSTVEVTLKRIRDADEYQTALSDCLAITQNMQAMIDNLLALARLDAHQMTFQRDEIQLAELINTCWQNFTDRAIQRNIVIDNRISPTINCQSDTKNLSMVLSNLLNNAVEYTNEGGEIWTAANKTDDSIEITIANTGCKLTAEQASQVFDYFWRADTSRTDTGIHCGLGLALVKKITEALGGSATVELHDDVFEIKLTVPI
ncbi:MAG: GHKL domain-containing protein [Planctomycetes bacterium]|nr:GHKL domain-containing protein [Planctomycetota bacterium]